MNAARWALLKPLFHGALDRPEAERDAWVRAEAGADTALASEALNMLHAHTTLGDFLEQPVEVDPADLMEALAAPPGPPAADLPSADEAAWPPGHRVGDYDIAGPIGRGGMGVVYLATDRRLGRRVALKVLPTSMSARLDLRERLKREARAAATITDPAVATVYALEEVEGQLLLASEYVSGPSLRELLRQGPLDVITVRQIALDVARGLRAAHAAAVVHRDLKPENILIATGGAKIVDFGIARTAESDERTQLTVTGAMLGTPAYMAPEQMLGGTVDARTDLYAFGVILLEMLSGRHPLSAGGGTDPGTNPTDDALARSLRQLADRCRHPDPSQRVQSAAELVVTLDGSPQPAPAQPPASAASTAAVTAMPTRWWWEFHQGAVAVSYGLILVPAWLARGAIGGAEGRSFFIATVCAALVASMLRLHLWFTSRQHPDQLPWARKRSSPFIRVADGLFVLSLVIGAVLTGGRSSLDVVLLVLAIGAAAASAMIEPVTARAAGIDT
jgi:hypothetical protein